MNIERMHYDLKFKLNKVDSQKYRNLRVPEIDWALNDAVEVLVKMIIYPEFRQAVQRQVGVEMTQRNTDDIRTIVVNQTTANGSCLSAVKYDDKSYVVSLPDNYWYHLSSYALAKKGECPEEFIRTTIRQHEDEHEESIHSVSSYEWREVNARFFENYERVFTDGTFSISTVCINYVRKMAYMHNAQDAQNGTYNLPGVGALAGTQDCELPEHMHREVVDMAVLILSGILQTPDYMVRKDKLGLIN